MCVNRLFWVMIFFGCWVDYWKLFFSVFTHKIYDNNKTLQCCGQGNGVTFILLKKYLYTFTMTLNLFVHLIKDVKTVIYSVGIPDEEEEGQEKDGDNHTKEQHCEEDDEEDDEKKQDVEALKKFFDILSQRISFLTTRKISINADQKSLLFKKQSYANILVESEVATLCVYQRGVSLILTELLMKTNMENNKYETKELLETDEFDCLSEKNAVELCAAFVQIRYSQF